MKEDINLLAPHVKIEILRRVLGLRINYIWRRLVIVVSSLTLLITGTGFVFQMNTRFFEASLTKNETQDTSTQKEISTINQFLHRFDASVKASHAWSPQLIEILTIMPEEVFLTHITARNSDGAFILKGVSSSRTAVIEYQRALEKISWIDHVEAPLQNFASGKTVDFMFTLFRQKNTPL